MIQKLVIGGFCLVVHGCKISFSKPTGHSLNKNLTYVLLLIIIIHKGN